MEPVERDPLPSEEQLLELETEGRSKLGKLGKSREALLLLRRVLSGYTLIYGEDHRNTLLAKCAYAAALK